MKSMHTEIKGFHTSFFSGLYCLKRRRQETRILYLRKISNPICIKAIEPLTILTLVVYPVHEVLTVLQVAGGTGRPD